MSEEDRQLKNNPEFGSWEEAMNELNLQPTLSRESIKFLKNRIAGNSKCNWDIKTGEPLLFN